MTRPRCKANTKAPGGRQGDTRAQIILCCHSCGGKLAYEDRASLCPRCGNARAIIGVSKKQ